MSDIYADYKRWLHELQIPNFLHLSHLLKKSEAFIEKYQKEFKTLSNNDFYIEINVMASICIAYGYYNTICHQNSHNDPTYASIILNFVNHPLSPPQLTRAHYQLQELYAACKKSHMTSQSKTNPSTGVSKDIERVFTTLRLNLIQFFSMINIEFTKEPADIKMQYYLVTTAYYAFLYDNEMRSLLYRKFSPKLLHKVQMCNPVLPKYAHFVMQAIIRIDGLSYQLHKDIITQLEHNEDRNNTMQNAAISLDTLLYYCKYFELHLLHHHIHPNLTNIPTPQRFHPTSIPYDQFQSALVLLASNRNADVKQQARMLLGYYRLYRSKFPSLFTNIPQIKFGSDKVGERAQKECDKLYTELSQQYDAIKTTFKDETCYNLLTITQSLAHSSSQQSLQYFPAAKYILLSTSHNYHAKLPNNNQYSIQLLLLSHTLLKLEVSSQSLIQFQYNPASYTLNTLDNEHISPFKPPSQPEQSTALTSKQSKINISHNLTPNSEQTDDSDGMDYYYEDDYDKNDQNDSDNCDSDVENSHNSQIYDENTENISPNLPQPPYNINQIGNIMNYKPLTLPLKYSLPHPTGPINNFFPSTLHQDIMQIDNYYNDTSQDESTVDNYLNPVHQPPQNPSSSYSDHYSPFHNISCIQPTAHIPSPTSNLSNYNDDDPFSQLPSLPLPTVSDHYTPQEPLHKSIFPTNSLPNPPKSNKSDKKDVLFFKPIPRPIGGPIGTKPLLPTAPLASHPPNPSALPTVIPLRATLTNHTKPSRTSNPPSTAPPDSKPSPICLPMALLPRPGLSAPSPTPPPQPTKFPPKTQQSSTTRAITPSAIPSTRPFQHTSATKHNTRHTALPSQPRNPLNVNPSKIPKKSLLSQPPARTPASTQRINRFSPTPTPRAIKAPINLRISRSSESSLNPTPFVHLSVTTTNTPIPQNPPTPPFNPLMAEYNQFRSLSSNCLNQLDKFITALQDVGEKELSAFYYQKLLKDVPELFSTLVFDMYASDYYQSCSHNLGMNAETLGKFPQETSLPHDILEKNNAVIKRHKDIVNILRKCIVRELHKILENAQMYEQNDQNTHDSHKNEQNSTELSPIQSLLQLISAIFSHLFYTSPQMDVLEINTILHTRDMALFTRLLDQISHSLIHPCDIHVDRQKKSTVEKQRDMELILLHYYKEYYCKRILREYLLLLNKVWILYEDMDTSTHKAINGLFYNIVHSYQRNHNSALHTFQQKYYNHEIKAKSVVIFHDDTDYLLMIYESIMKYLSTHHLMSIPKENNYINSVLLKWGFNKQLVNSQQVVTTYQSTQACNGEKIFENHEEMQDHHKFIQENSIIQFVTCNNIPLTLYINTYIHMLQFILIFSLNYHFADTPYNHTILTNFTIFTQNPSQSFQNTSQPDFSSLKFIDSLISSGVKHRYYQGIIYKTFSDENDIEYHTHNPDRSTDPHTLSSKDAKSVLLTTLKALLVHFNAIYHMKSELYLISRSDQKTLVKSSTYQTPHDEYEYIPYYFIQYEDIIRDYNNSIPPHSNKMPFYPDNNYIFLPTNARALLRTINLQLTFYNRLLYQFFTLFIPHKIRPMDSSPTLVPCYTSTLSAILFQLDSPAGTGILDYVKSIILSNDPELFTQLLKQVPNPSQTDQSYFNTINTSYQAPIITVTSHTHPVTVTLPAKTPPQSPVPPPTPELEVVSNIPSEYADCPMPLGLMDCLTLAEVKAKLTIPRNYLSHTAPNQLIKFCKMLSYSSFYPPTRKGYDQSIHSYFDEIKCFLQYSALLCMGDENDEGFAGSDEEIAEILHMIQNIVTNNVLPQQYYPLSNVDYYPKEICREVEQIMGLLYCYYMCDVGRLIQIITKSLFSSTQYFCLSKIHHATHREPSENWTLYTKLFNKAYNKLELMKTSISQHSSAGAPLMPPPPPIRIQESTRLLNDVLRLMISSQLESDPNCDIEKRLSSIAAPLLIYLQMLSFLDSDVISDFLNLDLCLLEDSSITTLYDKTNTYFDALEELIGLINPQQSIHVIVQLRHEKDQLQQEALLQQQRLQQQIDPQPNLHINPPTQLCGNWGSNGVISVTPRMSSNGPPATTKTLTTFTRPPAQSSQSRPQKPSTIGNTRPMTQKQRVQTHQAQTQPIAHPVAQPLSRIPNIGAPISQSRFTLAMRATPVPRMNTRPQQASQKQVANSENLTTKPSGSAIPGTAIRPTAPTTTLPGQRQSTMPRK